MKYKIFIKIIIKLVSPGFIFDNRLLNVYCNSKLNYLFFTFQINIKRGIKLSSANSDKLPEFKFSLTDQKARELPLGWAKQATVTDFPVSKNIAGVLMSLKPNGLRELHWQANAAEWGFVISGNVRTTIIDTEGQYETNEFKECDVRYFSRVHGHSSEGLDA